MGSPDEGTDESPLLLPAKFTGVLGVCHEQWNVSPIIGLKGFLAMAPLRLAWNAVTYHSTMPNMRASGVARSGTLQSEEINLVSSNFIGYYSMQKQITSALRNIVHTATTKSNSVFKI